MKNMVAIAPYFSIFRHDEVGAPYFPTFQHDEVGASLFSYIPE